MWMAVCGDLRFASHHDMMRVVERTLLRAKLPLKYSQGFSPRAIMSLAFPRPVGVATKSDLLVLSLESPILRQELIDITNRCCPKGLTFPDAIRLETKATPQPAECSYQITIDADKTDAVVRAVENFSAQETYTIQRIKPPKRRGRGRNSEPSEPITRILDLKLLIDQVEFDGATLSWTQKPHQTRWAKPTEAMKALGLDPVGDLAMVTRTSLTFQELNEYSGDADDETSSEPETT
jgi:radical SAM-linked protein